MKKQRLFFRKGSLVFKESGHPLRISDRHYRCDLDCRGKCKKSEPQIKKDTLEKAFTRICSEFELKDKTSSVMRKETFKRFFVDILLEDIDEKTDQQELIDITVSAMRADNKEGLAISESDIPDITASLVKLQEMDYPVLLFGYVLGMLKALSSDTQPADRAQNIALISKRIYLSPEGKIIEIEFERWGWYIINFIKKFDPTFLDDFKKVNILNSEEDELIKLDFKDALHYFDRSNFEEALHNHSANELYVVFKVIKDMTSSLVTGDRTDMEKALVNMVTQLTQLPSVEFAYRVKPLLQ